MLLDAAVTEYFYSKDLTLPSQRWYRQKLQVFLDWCAEQQVYEVEQLNGSLLRHFSTDLRSRVSSSSQTQHGYGRVVRNFLNFCSHEDWLPEGLSKKLPLPKRSQAVIEILSGEDIERLLEACTQPSKVLTVRDRAMVAVLADTGVRASELLSLTLDRLHFTQADAFIQVEGKGRKQREAGLGKRSRLALHRYISSFRPVSTHTEVFLTRDRKPLQFEGLYWALDRVGTRAHLRQHLHPHLFRHSFAFHYLMNGGDISSLSRLLGHTSIAVTSLYVEAFTANEARRGHVSLLDTLLR